MSPRRSHARRHPRNAWRYRLVGIALVLSAGALVTAQAASELALRSGLPVWVLVKAVTLRTHVYHARAR